jgi:membrane-bound lytic murein transglycosylase D
VNGRPNRGCAPIEWAWSSTEHKQKGLPTELAYLAMLESGLDPSATGPDGRRGLWQLDARVARNLDLVVRKDLDERTDPRKATQAAGKYLQELMAMFGGQHAVLFCIAAYGVGEGRIMGALHKIDDPMRSRDFWYALRQGALTGETSEYVARTLALMIVAEAPP